jgi:phosphoserine aminotransferase
MSETPDIRIPTNLLPSDGRFGCGPSKVRPEAIAGLAEIAPTYMGTSHRKPTVKKVVGRLRSSLRTLFDLPENYEVLIGNGGTTVLWDALTFGLIENKSQHLGFGEFSSKFAKAAKAAPFLSEPEIISTDPGTHPSPVAREDIDTYALTHNETSTGVAMPIQRPEGAKGLVAVDATSAAGGMRVDPRQFDCYYFAPQKCFASDGGLWIALVSPAALERIEAIEATKRWIPESIRLSTAVENSRLDQTYNTPSLATIYLMLNQIEWMNDNGGLEWAAQKSEANSQVLYSWAEQSSYATPFVQKPDERSPVVATIDFNDSIDAVMVSNILRANGVVDTDSYRKLGRNQIRVAAFPSIERSDIEALTQCIDHVVGQLGGAK